MASATRFEQRAPTHAQADEQGASVQTSANRGRKLPRLQEKLCEDGVLDSLVQRGRVLKDRYDAWAKKHDGSRAQVGGKRPLPAHGAHHLLAVVDTVHRWAREQGLVSDEVSARVGEDVASSAPCTIDGGYLSFAEFIVRMQEKGGARALKSHVSRIRSSEFRLAVDDTWEPVSKRRRRKRQEASAAADAALDRMIGPGVYGSGKVSLPSSDTGNGPIPQSDPAEATVETASHSIGCGEHAAQKAALDDATRARIEQSRKQALERLRLYQARLQDEEPKTGVARGADEIARVDCATDPTPTDHTAAATPAASAEPIHPTSAPVQPPSTRPPVSATVAEAYESDEGPDEMDLFELMDAEDQGQPSREDIDQALAADFLR